MVPEHHIAKEDIPELPISVRGEDVGPDTREALKGLGEDYADRVARHLAMCALLVDSDPELAYRHARTAADRAGRVAVVRETAGIAAYLTGRYAEAARELRTYQRLSGRRDHLAVIADCERGLGKPWRAIEIATSPEAKALTGADGVEMQIVLAGARADLGDYDAALAVLARAGRATQDETCSRRLALARDRIEALAAGVDSAEADWLEDPEGGPDQAKPAQPTAEGAEPVPGPSEPEAEPTEVALFDAEEGAW
jgi:hypothetical protein